jgi:hypothetical protein
MSSLALLLDTGIVPSGSNVAGVISLVAPLACLFLVLAWWGWIIRRRGGLP